MAKKQDDFDILEAIADEFDGVTVGVKDDVRDWIDTGNYAMNRIISGDYFKGYPTGKIVELYGEHSTGKSALVYSAIGQFQKRYGKSAVVFLDDTEDSYDPFVGRALGMNVDRLPAPETSSITVEDHFRDLFEGTGKKKKNRWGKEEESKEPVRSGKIPFVLAKKPDAKIMIVLDSMAMLSTDHEQETGISTDDMTKAKKIRAGMRTHWHTIAHNNILYLVTNHVGADIKQGPVFGNPKTVPGGRAIPFLASTRLELTYPKKIEQGASITGVTIHVEVKKNKVAVPFGKCEVDIIFNQPIDRLSGVVELLLRDEILKVGRRENKKGYVLPSGRFIAEDDMKEKFTEEVFLSLFDKLPEGDSEPEAKEDNKGVGHGEQDK